MRIQEQAFRAYYASMTDSDLLAVAVNRDSYLPLAQQVLSEEMARRKMDLPARSAEPQHPLSPLRAAFGRLFHRRAHAG